MYDKMNFEDWLCVMQHDYDYSYSVLLEFEDHYDRTLSNTANTTRFMNMYFN